MKKESEEKRGKKKEERRRDKNFAFFFLLSSFFLLPSCGFEPMYGRNIHESTGVENKLALVDIEGIPNREGQYLRNALIDRFYRAGRPVNPEWILMVGPVHEYLIDLDVTKSSTATRGQLRLNTVMELKNVATGEILLRRELQSITSYNIIASEFATRVTEDNARTSALDDLARQIELQLNLFFKRQ